MKSKLLLFTFLIIALFAKAQYGDDEPFYDDEGRTHYSPRHDDPYYDSDEKIQVALILDVSGSMEGLINQAKSQLWYIINGLTEGYNYREMPEVELALFELGNANLGSRSSYMRRVVPFTTDLDWISEELFYLRTGGSREYYGEAIDLAVTSLRWSNHPEDLKMIFVAGNEAFQQGRISYRSAIEKAARRGISVNTIYCGPYYQGKQFGWMDAAHIGDGEYMNIDHNTHIHYHGNHYDDDLIGLNRRFNETYIPYGTEGHKHKQRQLEQDRNSSRFGNAYEAQRMITKASRSYRNAEWDLIDAIDAGIVTLATIPDHELPSEMRNMTMEQKRAYVARKRLERESIKVEVRTLTQKRKVEEEQKPRDEKKNEVRSEDKVNSPAPRTKSLNEAIIESTKKQQEKKVEEMKRKELGELSSRSDATRNPQKSETPVSSPRVVETKSKPAEIKPNTVETKPKSVETKPKSEETKETSEIQAEGSKSLPTRQPEGQNVRQEEKSATPEIHSRPEIKKRPAGLEVKREGIR